jgi:dimethylglycine catabolism A
MWQPPERIRHPLPPARWPSEAEAARARLFSPIRVGALELAQRTWIPAMVPWRATDDGRVTGDVIDWYARFAQGRPGAIVVEATGIRDVPSGPLLRIADDRFIEGLATIVRAVREASRGRTKLFVQLLDFLRVRRRPPRERYLREFLVLGDHHRRAIGAAASDADLRRALLAMSDAELEATLSARELDDLRRGYRERVTDTHLPHIRELPAVLPERFAAAAERAFRAGFDGVELHYAHAYTMASFLSATNTRDDGYGGSRENRLRLPLEVMAAVRARVGAGRCVGVRFLGDEVIEGGSGLDEALEAGRRFAAAGADFLSISKGGKFDDAAPPKVGAAVYPYTGRSGYECMPTVFSDARGPFGRNVPLAAAIRRAVREAGFSTPVVAAGGIGHFAQAEDILRGGAADIVAAARQSLADPDWFLKMRLGRGDEIRRCQYTNYCEGLDQKHKQVTCKLWDRRELDEPGVPLDRGGRRRLIAPRWRPADPPTGSECQESIDHDRPEVASR